MHTCIYIDIYHIHPHAHDTYRSAYSRSQDRVSLRGQRGDCLSKISKICIKMKYFK